MHMNSCARSPMACAVGSEGNASAVSPKNTLQNRKGRFLTSRAFDSEFRIGAIVDLRL